MTDGAQRVADLVGDAGGQSAQGGEFELLGLLGDLRKILEKHQRVAIRTPCVSAMKLGCSTGPWPKW